MFDQTGARLKGFSMPSLYVSSHKYRHSWLEFLPVLILLGMLAGALGGLAIGALSLHSSGSSTSTTGQ
jgi:hypothetical protein